MHHKHFIGPILNMDMYKKVSPDKIHWLKCNLVLFTDMIQYKYEYFFWGGGTFITAFYFDDAHVKLNSVSAGFADPNRQRSPTSPSSLRGRGKTPHGPKGEETSGVTSQREIPTSRDGWLSGTFSHMQQGMLVPGRTTHIVCSGRFVTKMSCLNKFMVAVHMWKHHL